MNSKVIRQGKDSAGRMMPDLSSCCKARLEYLCEYAGFYIPCYKFEFATNGKPVCTRCQKEVQDE